MPADVVALVPAAGRGERLGLGLPKAFVPIGDATMLQLALDGLRASGVVDRIVVVVPADQVESTAELVADVTVVAGGRERSDSVRAGLAAVADAQYVLVHDAARALTPPEVTRRVVAALRAGHHAVVPMMAVTDTIKTVAVEGDDERIIGTPERASLRAVQTPQGFSAQLLRRAHGEASGPVTDDASLVEALGVPVHGVEGDAQAFKITGPLDLLLARAIRQTRERGAIDD